MNSYSTIYSGIRFPEGPAFDQKGRLWIVDKEDGSLICIYNNNSELIKTMGNPNGIAIQNNKVVFCDSGQNSVRVYDPQTGQASTLCNDLNNGKLKMPNDLAFDQNNRLVFSCPGDDLMDPEGYICVYNKENKLYKLEKQLSYPNGLAFSLNGEILYVAETGKRRIWKGDWDAVKGQWTSLQIFANTAGPENGGPDGIAVGANGWVYAAIYGSGLIQAFNQQGTLARQWKLPGKYPTNLAFIPPGNILGTGFVVTEVETGSVLLLNSD